jgi:uncharacterized DUF497 family protein
MKKSLVTTGIPEYIDIIFDWDPVKAASNFQKHGVDFNDATHVFADLNAVRMEDKRFDYGEKREKIVGTIEGALITAVIYTGREGRVRIISARKANRKEKRKYCHREGSSHG